jgi:phenylalanyl-tRNA synthetase alpha chain
MLQELDGLGAKALKDAESASSLESLDEIRVQILGKKGALSELLRGLKSVDASERPKIGAAANSWKQKIDKAIQARKEVLERKKIEDSVASEKTDITLPARLPHFGSLHPITQTTKKIIEVFGKLGFDVTTGPEVDTEFLTFDAINIPKNHPARDMQDTFFVGPGVVLRTHTSPVQMRAMRSRKWPVRILAPGAVYRRDNDATHSPMFHQIEGLWVDKQVKLSDLKGCLEFFAKEIFGAQTSIRLRPSYFPFTEPSAEVDVSCFQCRQKDGRSTGRAKDGSNCRLCKGTGWIEILGAGMVHPNLYKVAGYKSDEITGFAFGIGIERVAMLVHRISNIRVLYGGDVRFLRQF